MSPLKGSADLSQQPVYEEDLHQRLIGSLLPLGLHASRLGRELKPGRTGSHPRPLSASASGAEEALIGGEGTLEPTAGVDEDFDGTVVSVLVSQSDDDTGGRPSQRVCIGADGMRRALHTYTGH